MPAFTYAARQGDTEKLTGVIEASDRNDAVARLKRMGYFLLTVEPVRGGLDDGRLFTRRVLRRISKEDISVFTSQLASLLKAGLPLANALKGLQDQMRGSPLAEVIEQIGRAISESATLSESMARFPRLFPKTYTAAIRAGEEGGMLAEVLGRLAANLKAEIEVRGRIRGALAYPIFLCVLGGITLSVLLTFVIPRFTKLFVTMGEQLPLPTRLLLAFSGFMDEFWPIALGVFATAVVVAILAMKQEATRIAADRWLLAVPWLGSIIGRSEIARFARTLSELLSSGVPILSSLKITQGVMKNRCFVADLETLRTGIAKGQPVATVLKELPHFSPLVVNMVAVGEQSGQLAELLMEVADIYEKECERATQNFTTILGPSLIVVLGGVIAFVIAAILLPVFQASTLAG